MEIKMIYLLDVLFIFISCFEGCNLNVSDFEFERQLKLLNKPAVKTIETEIGAIYDCLNFYEQPAFDHPLAKKFILHLKIENNDYVYNEEGSDFVVDAGLRVGEGCPLGTVPIRRLTKVDIVRERDIQRRSDQVRIARMENLSF